MPSKKFKKAGLGVSVSLLSAVLLGSLFAGVIEPIVNSAGEKGENITASAADASLNTNYGAFADGATYSFSDKNNYIYPPSGF